MTIPEFLKYIADKNTSNEIEGHIMQAILKRVGFDKAIVTCGIVYLEGRGTLQSPPTSIHTIAKALIHKGGL